MDFDKLRQIARHDDLSNKEKEVIDAAFHLYAAWFAINDLDWLANHPVTFGDVTKDSLDKPLSDVVAGTKALVKYYTTLNDEVYDEFDEELKHYIKVLNTDHSFSNECGKLDKLTIDYNKFDSKRFAASYYIQELPYVKYTDIDNNGAIFIHQFDSDKL